MNIRGTAIGIYALCSLCVSGCDRRAGEDSNNVGTEDAQISKIVAGGELPEFSLASLENSTRFHTREDLNGKVYLLDFWATWCLPCVAELPNLHLAYETYGDRGFEILSVAMGDNRETIAELRETQWPMPWLHAFEALGSKATEPFELFGVPKIILVDSNHTIVGVDDDVRGEQLHATLAQLFGEAS